jgi:simple sugar transport system substrate-binding protein
MVAVMAGCSSSKSGAISGSGSSGKCSYTFAVITHGDNSTFWSVVYKGARDAARDYGCRLSEVYGSEQQGQANPDDNAENAQIQDAINSKVDGIAVSDHDPALMNATLAKAHAAGIPVVLLNAGCDNADIKASEALTCVGQPEQVAGEQAGLRMKKEGTTNVLCTIDQSGQNLLDRCNGLAEGLGVGSTCPTRSAPANGPACTELILSTPNANSNPQQAVPQITSYLQAHPGINAVLTTSSSTADALVQTNEVKIPISTFDLDKDALSYLKAGTLKFAIDQQQYLQGYLPIVFLYLYKKHEGNSAGGGTTVPSGPLIVDKSNIASVAAAVAAGDD